MTEPQKGKNKKHFDLGAHGDKLGLIIITMLFFLSLATAVLALRHNNMRMVELRQAVYMADEQNGDVNTALNNLRQYIYGHMNTGLRSPNSGDEPPIQLVHRFNRAVEAEQARVAAVGGANKIYVEAQKQCEQGGLPLTSRAQCMQDYITSHSPDAPQLNLPPKELYTFDFVSPVWSPDLAGFSVLATVILGLVIVAWLLSYVLVRFIKK